MSKPLASSTGIATGLVVPLAMAAPGNLDTGFADHGRIVMSGDFGGQAWSVDALDDGSALVAGGYAKQECSYYWGYYSCYYDATNFATELTITGEVDPSFTAAGFNDIEPRDAIRLPDGKTVLVGRRIAGSLDFNSLVVYRLDADGALDTTFGSQGIFELPLEQDVRHVATSVAQDPDGRIVISGSRNENLIVLRLLADGTLDASFGEGGIFTGPLQDYDARTFVERTAAAGYRVTTTGESQCRIVGLTAAGTMDPSFGTAGIAPVETGAAATGCSSMASLADGRLLLAGTADGQGFAARMLANGIPDPAFSAGAVAAAMTEATAITVGDDGRMLVAGVGEPGAMIMRLEPDGAVDASFGETGMTLIDLPSDYGSEPRIHSLDVRADGRMLAAGGDTYAHMPRPFVVQVLADGGDSPGVVGFSGPNVGIAEGGDLVVKVRRTGGKSGSVSVNYATAADSAWNPPPIPGEDFADVTGTLTWNDGDTSEREIVVPVHADAGSPEEHEEFRIALTNPQGGAGLGKANELVSILADGAPAGQFAVYNGAGTDESVPAEVWVYRNFYTEGAVSVTVTPVAGTATAGGDFDATPVTLTWADQDTEPKIARIGIVDDGDRESAENFTVELTNPTGGAIVGPYAAGAITIAPNDQLAINRGGGGGSTGWLSLLLLAFAELVRSSIRPTSTASATCPAARRRSR